MEFLPLGGTTAIPNVPRPRYVGEGVSFRAVRRVVFGTVPNSYPELIQVAARALRACSHRHLPQHWRNVRMDMYVTVHMQENRELTVDMKRLQRILEDLPNGRG